MGTDYLLQRWINLFPDQPVDVCLAVYRDIRSRYEAEGRGHHGLGHIRRMLVALDRYFPGHSRALELAIWLHDAIYVPGDPANERRSARLAFMFQQLGVPLAECRLIARLVRVTQYHVSHSEDEAALCDLDLMSMADSPAASRRTVASIRQEYAAFSDEAWMAGRKAFLERMYRRPYIFATPRFRRVCEEPARANLRDEYVSLGGTVEELEAVA